MRIVNLTQHNASPEQLNEGVENLTEPALSLLKRALTFDSPPTPNDINASIDTIVALAIGYEAAMIGGAPFIMSILENQLLLNNIMPLYAFTRRVVNETTNPDGQIIKQSIFRHEGFIAVKPIPTANCSCIK